MKGFSKKQEKKVTEKMEQLGVSEHLDGYLFIRIAILIMLRDGIDLGVTKVLYPEIGKICNKNAANVERAIKYTIQWTWNKDKEHFKTFLKNPRWTKRPTNNEFLAVLTEIVKYDL